MSVEFKCPYCGRLLRVPDDSAGRKAECPSCNAVCDVPGSAGSAAEGEDSWKVRTPEGEVYGPVNKAELDHWVAEGRLSDSCHIMHGGGSQWRPAIEVFPTLKPAAHGPASAGPSGQYTPPAGNPYVSPAAHAGGAHVPGAFAKPHRGAMILVFGILGFMVCGFFGVAAWIMGRSDLEAMNAGVMDNSGYGLTQAGWILGIIMTLLMVIPLVLFVIWLIIAAVVGIAGGF